jgi:hypothetical protein
MLILVKLLHTAVWAILVGCILALPAVAFRRRFDVALILTAVMLIECGILALNHFRCPLTDLAARYTQDRSDAFDIYLPGWLARYNQAIFGTTFVINEFIVLWLWRSRRHVLQPTPHDHGLDQSHQSLS